MLGQSSVGKTYLAQALLNAACRKYYTARFFRLDDLANRLDRAVVDGVALLALTIDARAIILGSLEDPPEGLRELRAVLKLPEIEKRLTELGMEVETSTPAQFSQRMAADLKRWKEIMDAIGYKPT